VFRNNLMANTRGCVNLEVFRGSQHNCRGECPDPAAEGYKVGALIYGNTCLQDKGVYVAGRNLAVHDNIDRIEIVDNVFSGLKADNCSLPTVASSLLTVDSNVFGTAPSDEDCRGTNARVGDVGISLDYPRVHAGRIPAPESFRPGDSSPARRAGDPAARTVIDLTAFPAPMRDFSWSTCRPMPAEWAKALSYDYRCEARDDRSRGGGFE
jgi:hypothetical protein